MRDCTYRQSKQSEPRLGLRLTITCSISDAPPKKNLLFGGALSQARPYFPMGGFGAAEMKQGGEVASLDQFSGQTVSIDWSQLTHSHTSSPACLKACVAWLVADDAAQL